MHLIVCSVTSVRGNLHSTYTSSDFCHVLFTMLLFLFFTSTSIPALHFMTPMRGKVDDTLVCCLCRHHWTTTLTRRYSAAPVVTNSSLMLDNRSWLLLTWTIAVSKLTMAQAQALSRLKPVSRCHPRTQQ